jgi:hypothetical protein
MILGSLGDEYEDGYLLVCSTTLHGTATHKTTICVLFSYACILIVQVFICSYIFMAMYSFVPPFCEITFCGVLSCVFDQLGCAEGEKRLQNTDVDRHVVV